MEWTLKDMGLEVSGGTSDRPLSGSYGLVFRLSRPARVFALDARGNGYSIVKELRPDAVATLVAYDTDGRLIDAVRVTYPTSRLEPAPTFDPNLSRRTLLVEACDGESIGRVDLGVSEYNFQILGIALLPSMP